MSQDERQQQSGMINSKRDTDQSHHNDCELISNLILDAKTSPESNQSPAATTSNKIQHHHHQVAQPQAAAAAATTTTTTTASNAMSNTQTKLVENLHSAANDGKVELVRLLLRCGADVNAQDEQFGNTALHQAAWNGFSETVQVLCKYRANTSIRNKAQFTPLHMAAQQGHNQTARLLLMASAKTEAKNSYGDTPLHTAARYGHAGVARILLSAKSNPNQVNKNNDTPLHIAAAMGRRKLTKIFMQNGAEPAIKNKQNETPMDIALRKDLVDIQELIANPPPMAANANSRSRRQTSESPRHAHLSQLEQRFGQLYSATSSQRIHSKLHQHQTPQQQQQQQQQVVLKTKHRHRSRQRHLTRHHTHLSSEDDSNELEQRMQRLHLHQSDASMIGRHEKCRKGGAFRVRGGDAEHLTASSASFLRCARMAVDELAVDVPDDINQLKRANNYNGKLLVNNKSAVFSSLHSLAPNNSHKRIGGRIGQLESQYRMKTIEDLSNQADLRLLPSLSNGGDKMEKEKTFDNDSKSLRGSTKCKRVTSSLELSGQSAAGEACPPDACDNPNDWADIMAKSALYRSTNSPVIESQLATRFNDKKSLNLSKNPKKPPAAGKKGGCNKIKLPSPTGSMRSSLSKSHGRVLVRRRKQKASFLVRRPNLGTCVGKLSLLKLRGVVNKRFEVAKDSKLDTGVKNDEAQLFDEQIEDKQNGVGDDDELETKQQVDVEVKREEASKMGDKSATASAMNKAPTVAQRKTPVAAGRRQERIERLEQSCALLAPNGSQLLRTRPLASLADDTQLYAVPKKTKSKQEELGLDGQLQQQQSGANCDVALDNSTATGERVPSGGPALTSDGGDRSSVNSSTSSFARITQHSSSSAIASSSDECIESMDLVCVNKRNVINNQTTNKTKSGDQNKRPAVVGVHIVGNTADLYAPGYSVIRKRPNKIGADNGSAGSSEACLCEPCGQLEGSDAIKTGGEKITLVEHNEVEIKKKPVKAASSSQLERQPANGVKQNINCNGESKATSKLRQLLHLDSRAKSGVKLNGQLHSEKVSNKMMTKSSEFDDIQNGSGQNNVNSRKDGPDIESIKSNKMPLTAIAGGYYAYSPVVQSVSELKTCQSNDVAKTLRLEQENNKPIDIGIKASGKKNWLMSKFSMSSNNVNSNNNNNVNNAANNELINSVSVGNKQSSILDTRKAGLAVDQIFTGGDETSFNPSNTLLGPERKAELINIISTDLRDNNNKGDRHELVPSLVHHDHTADGPNISPSSSHLIKPKSAFSATSADLIAAQKSLAAAAAEKVNRGRMVKLCSNGSMNNLISSNNSSQNDDLTTSKESILTVKTCDPFWSTVGHVVNQPIVAQNGINHKNYLIGQHQLVNRRSGTNSVGMSDSSPSNNGAESDNSIQTTTGSANTDTTTSGGIESSSGAGVNGITGRVDRQLTTNSSNGKSRDQSSASSPLGILSRILLNNKSFGYRTTTSSLTANKESEPLNSIDSMKGSTQLMQTTTVADSLSSPLALSLPSSNNRSSSTMTTTVVNGTTTATDTKTSLDQLTSRSRCPIVLTKSNGLPSETEEEENRNKKGKEEATRKKIINDSLPGDCNDDEDSTAAAALPPPLPAKGVLKMPSSRVLIQNNHSSNKSAASNGSMPSILLDSMNGLPRVSSYTQISASSLDQCPLFKQPFYAFNHPKAAPSKQQLCNYHLLNQQINQPTSTNSQLLQPQHYNPYSSSIACEQGDGYCQDSSCREFMNKSGNRYHHLEQLQPQQHLHHMSHHDLRSTTNTTTSSLADITALPASANINYEYYFDNSPYLQHHHPHHHHLAHNGNHPNSLPCHYTTAASSATTNNKPIHYLNYTHDDSIYIPDYLMNTTTMSTKNSNKINRGISNQNTAGSNELSQDNASLMSKQSNFFNRYLNEKHQLVGRPRPKSSLDTPFISSDVNQHHYPSPSPMISTTNNGRHFSANLNSSNNRPVLNATEILTANSKHHRLLSPSSVSSSNFPLKHQDHSSHQTNGSSSSGSSKSESQNSPSSVGNQSLLGNHNIGHFEQHQQPTYYSYSSPYHNMHNHNTYLYSENSIYASDQSVAFNRSSDLTVLPTIASDTNIVDSSNDPKHDASMEVKVTLASGGYNNSFKSGANKMVTCSTSSNNTQCPSSPASNLSDRSRTPKAQQPQQQQQVVDQNSWIPNQPYKSLIQIRQLSAAKPDQSLSVSENTGQQMLSSGLTNNQSNNGLEEETSSETKEADPSSSKSKGPTKVFVSNRAQTSKFEDKKKSSASIPVVCETTSTVL